MAVMGELPLPVSATDDCVAGVAEFGPNEVVFCSSGGWAISRVQRKCLGGWMIFKGSQKVNQVSPRLLFQKKL